MQPVSAAVVGMSGCFFRKWFGAACSRATAGHGDLNPGNLLFESHRSTDIASDFLRPYAIHHGGATSPEHDPNWRGSRPPSLKPPYQHTEARTERSQCLRLSSSFPPARRMLCTMTFRPVRGSLAVHLHFLRFESSELSLLPCSFSTTPQMKAAFFAGKRNAGQ